jgi:perosamine synthetase
VKLDAGLDRDAIFRHLRAAGIGANVHYAPVYRHSYYRARGYAEGLCPVAEEAARNILTLPMFPAMTGTDVNRVVAALQATF